MQLPTPNKKEALISGIFAVCFLCVILFLGLRAASQKQTIQSPAKTVMLNPVRGTPGDFWADTILGQPDFTEGMIRDKVSFKVNNPGGTWIDTTTTPDRIYVADNANSRILGYASLGTCQVVGKKTTVKLSVCTTDADCGTGTCVLQVNKPADIVIGQPNFSRSACNGDTGYQFYPDMPTPNPGSLCGMPPIQNSPTEGGNFVSMDTDSAGNLYYPDWINNRVLKYTDPFATDQQADAVWGQSSYSGYQCNKGQSNPASDTLCFGQNTSSNGAFVIGVDIDAQGNLWVADTKNNRVLRFPFDSTLGRPAANADLVLGQQNFTSKAPGSSLQHMYWPAAVRVDAAGSVFVVDAHNNRVLKFSAPLTSGMLGVVWGSQFNYPTGIEIDALNGGIWVNDTDNHMVELWNTAGTTVLKVLYKDQYLPNLSSLSATCNSPVGVCAQNDSRGSIGITQTGDLFIASSYDDQDVIRFKYPIPTPQPGVLPSADYRMYFPPNRRNYQNAESLYAPFGITVSNNQLIVSDGYRLLFWNDLQSFSNGKPADGYVGVSNFTAENPTLYGRIKADSAGHLFVTHGNTIEVFQLPLQIGATPSVVFGPLLKTLENTQIDLTAGDGLIIGGLYPSASGDELWIAHNATHRAIRIENPLEAHRKVNVVLGQVSPSESLCNRGGSMSNSTLCYPGAIVLDKNGDIYVSDNSLEFHGNGRLLRWDSTLFPADTSSTIYGTPATEVLLSKHIFEPAFNSLNQMAVGTNVLISAPTSHHSIELYQDIAQNPQNKIDMNDFIKLGYSMTFDDNNNLYVTDINRWKVLIFKNVVYTPSPTPTLTPTPLPQGTPPPTPVATSTPPVLPTPTPFPQEGQCSPGYICSTTISCAPGYISYGFLACGSSQPYFKQCLTCIAAPTSTPAAP